MWPVVLFSKPKLRHAQRKIEEIVMDICAMGATLMGRSYFGRILPNLSGAKNNFTMALLDIFDFWDAKSEKRPMEIREIIEDIRGTCLSLMHVFVFGGPFPFFYRRQKPQFWAKFLTGVTIGGLLFHSWEEYGKSKT